MPVAERLLAGFVLAASRCSTRVPSPASVSHFAFFGPLSSKTSTRHPMITDGMPSSRNSHCQPAQAVEPSMYCMIAPETGEPITFEIAMAVMNSATIWRGATPGTSR